MKKILVTLLLVATSPLQGRDYYEVYYQNLWHSLSGGQTEVVFEDRTRCDILTETHAIEVDFADKWAEAVGQAAHYATLTGKRAGILLIIEDASDFKYLLRLENLIEYHNLEIDVWTILSPDLLPNTSTSHE